MSLNNTEKQVKYKKKPRRNKKYKRLDFPLAGCALRFLMNNCMQEVSYKRSKKTCDGDSQTLPPNSLYFKLYSSLAYIAFASA